MFSGWNGEHRSPTRGRCPRLGCSGGLCAIDAARVFASPDESGDYIGQCVGEVKRSAVPANAGSFLEVLTRSFAERLLTDGSSPIATSVPDASTE